MHPLDAAIDYLAHAAQVGSSSSNFLKLSRKSAPMRLIWSTLNALVALKVPYET